METTQQIDLSPFLSKDGYRPNIQRPFSIGEWTYATDGRVLVRVPRRDDVPEYTDSPMGAEGVIPTETRELLPLPAFERYKPNPDERECRECHGEGVVECSECGHESDCETCGGDGVQNRSPEPEAVEINGHHFCQKLLTRISELPDLKFGVGLGHLKPARFTFSGGEGTIMPRHPK